MYKIAIVDDHTLLASSLEKLLTSFGNCEVLHISKNGKEFQQKLKTTPANPDIVLLDINMPVMDGYETAQWIKKNQPSIKVLALSMEDDESAILKMIHNGAKGYLLKDTPPETLQFAIEEIMNNGYYHSDLVATTLVQAFHKKFDAEGLGLRDKEIQFIKLAATERTYKQIAEEMNLSPKTIDGYRQEVFQRYNIKNRVGLVLFAIKNGLVEV
ncbi:response regulator transcription factor [Marinirhabdus gelatinilytica]|uniref:LuxR family two component transcriptional regulator n=1 Tax=Marinirhabdus gelatinilytica TaxID=1703343 RepID=A0A370QFY8_9FLAO|nr:response regulator transcription factor [Marinirhabdus gelatinilytica]RDK87272.1 LuxR family two component transcriptional regulator [Marinirhabdus gelatinilytica]